jgi:hypothetical protein
VQTVGGALVKGYGESIERSTPPES